MIENGAWSKCLIISIAIIVFYDFLKKLVNDLGELIMLRASHFSSYSPEMASGQLFINYTLPFQQRI